MIYSFAIITNIVIMIVVGNGKRIEVNIPQGAIDGQSMLLAGVIDGYQDRRTCNSDQLN